MLLVVRVGNGRARGRVFRRRGRFFEGTGSRAALEPSRLSVRRSRWPATTFRRCNTRDEDLSKSPLTRSSFTFLFTLSLPLWHAVFSVFPSIVSCVFSRFYSPSSRTRTYERKHARTHARTHAPSLVTFTRRTRTRYTLATPTTIYQSLLGF